jgi:hypothetical protein
MNPIIRIPTMKLPAETQTYIATLFLRTGNIRRTWRFLILRWGFWLDGTPENAIPGFSTCPPDSGKGYPRGMSYRTVRKFLSGLTIEHGTARPSSTDH